MEFNETTGDNVVATPPRRGPPRSPRLVLLPTLNEEEGLGPTLTELHRVAFGGSDTLPGVLVVDGRSTDRTIAIAEEYGVPVLVQQGRGKGAAIREGLTAARAQGYRSVAVMDADNTYPASSLPALFELLDLGADLVIGMRRPERPAAATLRDVVHRVGNGILNYAAAQASGQPLLDVCSGFWGVRLESMEGVPLESEGFEVESELFLKSFRAGLQVVQLPIGYRTRAGEAKLRAFHDGSRILLSILRNSVRPIGHSGRPPAGAVGRANVQVPFSSLQRTLLGLNPDRLVVLSAPDRFAEAELLAARYGAGSPDTEVITAMIAPEASEGPDRTSHLLSESAGYASTVVVLFPQSSIGAEPGAHSLIGIPRSQRIIEVPHEQVGEGTNAADPRPAPRHDGLRSERVRLGYRGAWFILGATLEPSWVTRELALLQANPTGSSLRVFRRDAPPSARLERVGRWTWSALQRALSANTEATGS